MKRKWIPVVSILAMAALISGAAGLVWKGHSQAASEGNPDSVRDEKREGIVPAKEYMATVDGEKITVIEYKAFLSMAAENEIKMDPERYKKEGDAFWDTWTEDGIRREQRVKAKALEDVKQFKVLCRKAAENNIRLDDSDQRRVETVLKNKRLIYQGRREEYYKWLNSIGVRNEKEFLDIYSRMILNEKLLSKLNENMQSTDAEAEEYYRENREDFDKPEELWITDIFIKTVDRNGIPLPKALREKALERMKEALARVESGESFEKVAFDYCTDDALRKMGCRITLKKMEGEKEYVDLAFSLELNEVSNIFETAGGYHVFKLTARRALEPMSFDSQKPVICTYLSRLKQIRLRKEWFESARLEINGPVYDAILLSEMSFQK